jgi:nucleoside-diphosphate-sugar epimerase
VTPRGGSTVLVTGGSGFLGRHLVDEFDRAGTRVVAPASTDYDLRDRPTIDRMLRDHTPDAVVHLAAIVGGIGANRAEPGRFFYENAIMGIELLEACRTHEIAKVLVAGTVCAYPKHADVPFREAALWDGYPEETNAPYGLAKKILLVQAQAYREQYGMNVIYLLPTNLYGPGDNFDLETSHVIPAMIRRFLDARDRGASDVELWGDGSPTREFLHVRDGARALRLALERYEDAEPVNVGSGDEIAIRDLARLIADAVGYRGAISWDTSKPNGQPRRRLDVSRARAGFGFEASITMATGIPELVAWYETQPAAHAT